ncbi:hypothetical protein cce_4937 [Crocosphaera subtropica ATCC 51142]|uniref:Uncharacterized protein n=1 Tax=Crocosphaera subtropica (strain ATCC 51142 / BH68) TaxID=43989 RepID=B1X2C2_CROS5|nr:hypothetical protein [Crocosphaera subtropica]ACB54283.1 hypothetical protein cce_4937 [Crocosphaera subtropica ATCC 51142]
MVEQESKAVNSIVLGVVELQDLTDSEQKERLRLERQVERAFYVAGCALAKLKTDKLYRSTHSTFEDYCQDRFSFTRRHVNYLIAAAGVVDNLKMGTNCSQNNEDAENLILPTTASQCRPLTALEPLKQVEAWSEAITQAGGKVPPARIVQEVVQNMQQQKKIPNPWHVGEVAQIVVKGNSDLKGKGGCWAVIVAVNDFSCSVQLWDGEYQVKPENLKELPYSNEQQKEIKELSDLISKIKLDDIEQPTRDFLAGLGKINRPWLTELEKSILEFLEKNFLS